MSFADAIEASINPLARTLHRPRPATVNSVVVLRWTGHEAQTVEDMGFRQHLIAVVIVSLTTLVLYLLIAAHILQDPPARDHRRSSVRAPPAAPVEGLAAMPEHSAPVAKTGSENVVETPGGRKRLEISGRVLDRDGYPIADALIAEERYFHQVRSGVDGSYRLELELPRHRYPRLHFLRSGYAGRLIKLGADDLQQNRAQGVDVVLDESPNTVSLQGWVGDEIGIGLEGARVELSAAQTAERDSYYLTVFTDENGYFGFEGVEADQHYGLSINLAPDYPYYQDPAFQVTRNPGYIDIRLEKLKFVDIDGMLVNDDATPVPNYEMYVINLTTGGHNRKIVSDSSGYFSLRNFPLGEISLSTRDPEFYRITGVTITETHYQNLQLQVDHGTRHLFGWVSDASGVGIEKAMVTLDRDFRDGEVEHYSYRSQATDRNGAFSFSALGGGEYRLTVYALGFQKRDLKYRLDGPSGELFIALEPY